MRTKIALALGVAAVSLSGAGAALAVSPNHFAPGTPGDPNCESQTTAMLAQSATLWSRSNGGLSGAAEMRGVSVADLQAAISDYCNAGGPPP